MYKYRILEKIFILFGLLREFRADFNSKFNDPRFIFNLHKFGNRWTQNNSFIAMLNQMNIN